MTRHEKEQLVGRVLGPGVAIPYWFGPDDVPTFLEWLAKCRRNIDQARWAPAQDF